MRFAYPLMLDVSDRLIVIIGGGAVAARKAATLLECGAKGPVGRRSLPFSLTPAAWKAPCRDKPPVL